MPDGKEILFSARGSLWRLVVTGEKPGESSPARLPFAGEDGIMPVVSRSQPGRPSRLVYVRSSVDTNIWRVQTSTAGAPASAPPVVAISSTRMDAVAQFSPDGSRVVFCSNRAGSDEIWVSDADGSNASQLTSITGCTPRWSPDGQTIAFDSNIEGKFEIYLIAASGGRPRRLTFHPANDHVPSFSRDGKWVYFSSNRSGEYQIWKIPVSGGEAVQVTHNGAWAAFESPDGAYLYYTQTSIAPSALWRVPVSGGQPVKVLEGVVWGAFAVVEKGIYYIDQLAGEARLQFFDIATGRSTIVAHKLGEVFPGLTISPDGRTILYTRVDSSVDDLMLVENFR
jgi:Tol biopolymer transport system component